MAPERSGWQPAGENAVLAQSHAAPPLLARTRRANQTLNGGAEYRIGRDPSADIPLDDSRVSWRHAVLRDEGGTWVLEDVGSTNGTWNGAERITRLEIRAACVLRLGDSAEGPLLRLEPHAAGAAAPSQASAPTQHPRVSPPAGSAAPFEPAPRPGFPPPSAPTPAGPGAGLPAYGSAAPLAYGTPPPPRGTPPSSPGAGAVLPSVDRRPTSRYAVPTKSVRIGRTPDNDLVVSDLGVSRHHAELRKTPAGGFEIADLGSHNGTFVNGERITRRLLTDNDLISIGHSTFRLAQGELREYVDEGSVSFEAHDLKVIVSGGKVLLDVTFPVPERCLMAVIGPSGAGKSTLLNALTGMRPADTGTVLYDSRDLYRDYAELRYRIGLVPQREIVHTQLTARKALGYAAELRFPSDTGHEERGQRVEEVIGELGLARHADKKAENLSGGQLKRVSVAMELLTKPSLLFLDEPTSGLDPGMDKSIMEQMRDLAHDGRTVIVVTHSMENLDTCDRLLVLAPGGRISYYGPPDEGLKYYGKPRWADVFQQFEKALDDQPNRDWGAEWAAQYKASPYYQKYIVSQQSRPQTPRRGTQPDGETALPTPRRRGSLNQLSTLSRRYARVLASDKGFLLITAILPIILGGLIAGMSATDKLGLGPAKIPPGASAATAARITQHGNENAITTLLVLVVCACLAGAANSVRELVKERPIYIRERAAGESSGAYLLSKVLVLSVISLIQSVILLAIGLSPSLGKLPPTGSALHHAAIAELLIAMVVLTIATMCLGLLISALVRTSEMAMPILVGITMIQVVLSGGIGFSVAGVPVLGQIAWLAPSNWGMSALASTTNLNHIQPAGSTTISFWDHTASAWGTDIGALVGLAVLFVLIAWWRLTKLSPGRRR